MSYADYYNLLVCNTHLIRLSTHHHTLFTTIDYSISFALIFSKLIVPISLSQKTKYYITLTGDGTLRLFSTMFNSFHSNTFSSKKNNYNTGGYCLVHCLNSLITHWMGALGLFISLRTIKSIYSNSL